MQKIADSLETTISKANLNVERSAFISYPSTSSSGVQAGSTIRFPVHLGGIYQSRVSYIKDVRLQGQIQVLDPTLNTATVYFYSIWQLLQSLKVWLNGSRTTVIETDAALPLHVVANMRRLETCPSKNEEMLSWQRDGVYLPSLTSYTTAPFSDEVSVTSAAPYNFDESICGLIPFLKGLDVRHLVPNQDDHIRIEAQVISQATQLNYKKYLHFTTTLTSSGAVTDYGGTTLPLQINNLALQFVLESYTAKAPMYKPLETFDLRRMFRYVWPTEFGTTTLQARINLKLVFPSINNVARVYLAYLPVGGAHATTSIWTDNAFLSPLNPRFITNLQVIRDGVLFYTFYSGEELYRHQSNSWKRQTGNEYPFSYQHALAMQLPVFVDLGLLLSSVPSSEPCSEHACGVPNAGTLNKVLYGVNIHSTQYELLVTTLAVTGAVSSAYEFSIWAEQDRLVTLNDRSVLVSDS